ncbi:Spy/CpxP family protein refolding chaperone [Taklimakanibacter deserti]|uniref:Spy/CpxP family protein refolding chaperone n=1 Tax=Taklimakanibacter deserti TaxID=2267839 RepID=UPI000E65DB7D
MTDQTNLPVPYNGPPPSPPRRGARGLLLTLIIVLASGLTGVFVSQAMSEESGWGSGFGPGGWHHGGWMGGPPDPAQIENHVDRAIRHLAIEIDATTEQQDKLRAIVKSALKDLLPLIGERQKARERARDLLTRPTIDRAELEKFRAEHMAMWEGASKRITQALGDAAEALTPQQRQKLAELLAERRGFWHGWHRG